MLPRPGGAIRFFNHPSQPVVGVSWFDAAAYCEWLRGRHGKTVPACLAKRNGSGRRAGARRTRFIHGGIFRRESFRTMRGGGRPGRKRWGCMRRTQMGCYNLGTTCTSGARTGMTRDITACRRSGIRGGRNRGSRRASRGGSWRHHIKVTRTAARSSIPPEFKYADYGFRVAGGMIES